MTTETSLLLPLIPFVPLLAALFVSLGETNDAGRQAAFVFGTVPSLVLGGLLLARLVTPHGGPPLILTAWGGFLYADVLSALMICCTFLVVASVGIYSFAELTPDPATGALISPAQRLHRAELDLPQPEPVCQRLYGSARLAVNLLDAQPGRQGDAGAAVLRLQQAQVVE